MATIAPTTYLPGIKFLSSDGGGAIAGAGAGKDYILIDKADLPAWDSAGVGDDADIRRLIFALLHGIHAAYQTVSNDGISTIPTKWVSALSSNFSGDDVLTRTYVNQFTTGISGEEVADE